MTPHARNNRHTQEELKAASMRAMLEDIRLLAAQSGLLALNTAFESADALAADGLARDMPALAAQAKHAVAEADRVNSAVGVLLQQIESASALARHCG